MYWVNVTNKSTTCYWFELWRHGHVDLKNGPSGHLKASVNNDELKAIVEADNTLSTHDLGAAQL